jgi:hypothetical protein
MTAAMPAFFLGVFWAIEVTLVPLSFSRYGASLSRIALLYNMNTLVTVIGALLIFCEWRDVPLLRLLLGSVLIITGGVLVSS